MSLPEKLRAARKAAGLTQVALAARMGMTQGAISHIEKGDSGISMEGLLKWSEACGTELSLIGPTSEEGLRLLVALDPRRLTLAMRFLRAMPSLDPAHIITLEALIETWIKGPSGRGR